MWECNTTFKQVQCIYTPWLQQAGSTRVSICCPTGNGTPPPREEPRKKTQKVLMSNYQYFPLEHRNGWPQLSTYMKSRSVYASGYLIQQRERKKTISHPPWIIEQTVKAALLAGKLPELNMPLGYSGVCYTLRVAPTPANLGGQTCEIDCSET